MNLRVDAVLDQILLLLEHLFDLLVLYFGEFVVLKLHHVAIELVEAPHRNKIIDLREESAVLALFDHQILHFQLIIRFVLLGVVHQSLVSCFILPSRCKFLRLISLG